MWLDVGGGGGGGDCGRGREEEGGKQASRITSGAWGQCVFSGPWLRSQQYPSAVEWTKPIFCSKVSVESY
jgi:hypothetical protein